MKPGLLLQNDQRLLPPPSESMHYKKQRQTTLTLKMETATFSKQSKRLPGRQGITFQKKKPLQHRCENLSFRHTYLFCL
jgi:hypothetical protein